MPIGFIKASKEYGMRNFESRFYYAHDGSGSHVARDEDNGVGLNGEQHFNVGILPGQTVNVEIRAEGGSRDEAHAVNEFTTLSSTINEIDQRLTSALDKVSKQVIALKGSNTTLKKQLNGSSEYGEKISGLTERVEHLQGDVTNLREGMIEFMTEIRNLLSNRNSVGLSESPPPAQPIPELTSNRSSEEVSPTFTDVVVGQDSGAHEVSTAEVRVENHQTDNAAIEGTVVKISPRAASVPQNERRRRESFIIEENYRLISHIEPEQAQTIFTRIGNLGKKMYHEAARRVKKADKADNLPIQAMGRDVFPVPRLQAALLTEEQQENYRREATDKFHIIYQEVFRGSQKKDAIQDEQFVGAIVPVTVGITTAFAPLPIPLIGVAVVGVSTYAVSEVRRHSFKENVFDQFKRFSFTDGKPDSRFHWFVKGLQMLGRGPERAYLKNSLGLNNFMGSRALRELVGYMDESGNLNVPEKIVGDGEKVDKLLGEATWYLNSTQALVELDVALKNKEKQAIRENRPKIAEVRDKLLVQKYPDAVSRSYFADRLHKTLTDREERVFNRQVAGLTGIEMLKTAVMMAPIAYVGRLAEQAQLGFVSGNLRIGEAQQLLNNTASSAGNGAGRVIDALQGWLDSFGANYYAYLRPDQCNYFAIKYREIMGALSL